MKSLFLKMFLWFCAANTLVTCVTVVGYELANPDQLPFTWPRVGKGAIVSAARVAVETYERGGPSQLAQYLAALEQDTGLKAGLFDSSNHELGRRASSPSPPDDLAAKPAGQLMIRVRGRFAGIHLPGGVGGSYAFVVTVPPREASGFWSRWFIFSLILTGTVLCYLLARYVTAPVVHLRGVAFRFSRGELGALAGDFNQMAERIESLMKAQQRLIADVSHELRSPITRLSLALGLVRQRKGGDATAPLARIEREVDRLNTLIGQLLTLSRLESVDKPPPMEMLDLGTLVKEISADANFEAATMNRGVQLLECAACSMLGSRDLIGSAVENVVRNALKYTRPNTDVLVRLLRVNEEPTATIVVQDHGPGVPTQALAHIFEPFYRVDDARDRGSGGAGLGLAITHEIVRLHGGSVKAVNQQTGGLELRVSLPLADPRDGN